MHKLTLDVQMYVHSDADKTNDFYKVYISALIKS